MTICLLDLNYTLVANSDRKASPFIDQIRGEVYRADLLDKLKALGWPVVLLTARPASYEAVTLQSIKDKTGWAPSACYFNFLNLPPPLLKQEVLKTRILPQHSAADILAVESNPKTRAMFSNHGVRSMPYAEFMGTDFFPR